MKTLILTFLLSALALAADVSGKYTGTFTAIGPDGQPDESEVLIILKQSGTEVTGSGGPDALQQFPIRNGKIAGNTITAEAVSPDGPVYKLTLTVAGDKLTGNVDVSLPDGGGYKAKLAVTRIK